jgi:hypothetical protein
MAQPRTPQSRRGRHGLERWVRLNTRVFETCVHKAPKTATHNLRKRQGNISSTRTLRVAARTFRVHGAQSAECRQESGGPVVFDIAANADTVSRKVHVIRQHRCVVSVAHQQQRSDSKAIPLGHGNKTARRHHRIPHLSKCSVMAGKSAWFTMALNRERSSVNSQAVFRTSQDASMATGPSRESSSPPPSTDSPA